MMEKRDGRRARSRESEIEDVRAEIMVDGVTQLQIFGAAISAEMRCPRGVYA